MEGPSWRLTAVVWCCLVAGTLCQQQAASDHAAQAAVIQGNNAFSIKLYKELTRTPGNVFFSPLSVQVVLALAWLGAKGETASQIAAGLHLPNSRLQVETGFRALMTNLLSKTDNITLDIANKIYAQEGFNIYKEFQESAKHNFLSEAQEVDFQNHIETARNTINQWVEEKTRNRIKELLAKDTVDYNTVMVLVNAIYFKGKWLKIFNESLTQTEPFHINFRSSKYVSMMHISSSFKYAEFTDLNAKALQIDYVNEELSMLILLPNEIDGLPQLEAKLPGLDLVKVVDSLRYRLVNVSLPKFKLEKLIDLNDILKKLGMTNMFEDNADFSGLTSHKLKVSKVVQKSFLEVTEEGSEAAVATAVSGITFSTNVHIPPPPAVFTADHPFMFFIRENTSGAILFVGVLSDLQ